MATFRGLTPPPADHDPLTVSRNGAPGALCGAANPRWQALFASVDKDKGQGQKQRHRHKHRHRQRDKETKRQRDKETKTKT